MRKLPTTGLLMVAFALAPAFAIEGKNAAATHAPAIGWTSWSSDIFTRAASEHKLVILDLEAVWCHWCHVMDERTYADAQVAAAINADYIPVRVDQDSRPDLSNRYQDYGWPATIIFAPDGTELAKRAGFVEPDEMASLLQTLARTRKPEEKSTARAIKYAESSALGKSLKQQLIAKHIDGFDTANGAWSTGQKFMDADSEEYALTMAKQGDAKEKTMARRTLDAQLNLVDPIWGGVCQYSTHNDWKRPHYEKIMSVQSDNLRMYSLGYLLFGEQKYLATAKRIFSYLDTFLRAPEGPFYCSQDADLVPGEHSDAYYKLSDAQRRKQGIPRIDKHIYARENGWAISGILALYAATGEKQYLDVATKAAQWILAHRSLSDGGFLHGEHDPAGPYLGDTLYMGRALLDLYGATGDRHWLQAAQHAANFIVAHFSAENPGLVTSEQKPGAILHSEPLIDENVAAARFFNLLNCYAPAADYAKAAANCMKYLATPQMANQRKIFVGGILLADRELNSPPVHITVVGGKNDPKAKALFVAALRYPVTYKQVEWYDKSEGLLASGAADFPEMDRAAAFGCANKRCSLPIFEATEIAKTIDDFTGDSEAVDSTH